MNPESRRSDVIDQWLPQTQCTRCGYPRCYAYAEAIAAGEADINQCPPGGEITIRALSNLIDDEYKPLNAIFGQTSPRLEAIIREQDCIGCTICIQACPVDAILGAGKLMHTVISDECTGCGLCVPPCPVDCIDMVAYRPNQGKFDSPWPEFTLEQVSRARRRSENRISRLATRTAKRGLQPTVDNHEPSTQTIRADIQAAIARVRARRPKKSV
ncbi:RnfABCDGE type electron transport complex subunit B [Pseudomonadota bacterium]